jgi:CHAT domain-containing protein
MFNDPALIFACDLPIGWCLDAESSLFRLVFRPWDSLDERVILTTVPTPVAPTTPDDGWASAAAVRYGTGGPVEALSLAAGAAFTTIGQDSRRIVVRGAVFDLVADHVQTGGLPEEISPVLLRIAASARIPARPPLVGMEFDSLEELRAGIEAIPEGSDVGTFIQALLRLESAAEERWLESFLRGDLNLLDLNALAALFTARINLGYIRGYLLNLFQAHAVVLRAVPGRVPSDPYIPVDDQLRPALAELCEGLFGWVAAVLRRRPEMEKYKNVPDDLFGSDAYLQMLIGILIIEDVRSAFEQAQPVSSAAAYQGLFAQLCSQAMMLRDPGPDQNELLANALLLLGRALTAYIETAQHEDDRDHVVEAADYLAEIGRKLFDLAAKGGEQSELYSSQGATLVATGLANHASALVNTADQASLEEALRLTEVAHDWLKSAPEAYVDRANISHVEALAALQLGDVERARQAVLQGRPAAEKITEQFQIDFFDWASRTAGVVGSDPRMVRTLPELQHANLEAEAGADAALEALCAALARELADDPIGPTTIERLVLAARILEGHGSEEILAAVDSLLGLKRLLVSSQRDLQLGADDSLLARRVAAEIVSQKVADGELKAAVAGADRARARSLLLDLTLAPGQTAHLRELMGQVYNPGIPALVEALSRDRIPESMKWIAGPPPWAGPGVLGTLRSMSWLQGLSKDLRDWVSALTEPLGVSPLTEDEMIQTAVEHRQPILVLHPTDERVALFVIKPDGEIHHTWSAGTTEEIFAQAEQLRADLGVWVSARQVGQRRWSAASGNSLAAYRAATASLYKSLFEPLQAHLAGYNDLTIVPYRELGSLPFALLEDGTGAPLLDRFSISIAPSIASLHVLKHRSPSSAIPPFAFVIGNPATPHAGSLPDAAIEAGIVRDRLATAHPTLPILFRTDSDATPADYIKSAPWARIVHLACHASVGMTASASALCLAPGPNGDSMLDFAEVSRVPLNNALVFLAACRTGTGRTTADGTVGLAREFLRAGARAVVASYWKVSDEATRVLVDHFYNFFLGGGAQASVATALRDAMSATRDQLSLQTSAKRKRPTHPGSWGPFFVLGDGSLRNEL